jgi:hypothetical protein
MDVVKMIEASQTDGSDRPLVRRLRLARNLATPRTDHCNKLGVVEPLWTAPPAVQSEVKIADCGQL